MWVTTQGWTFIAISSFFIKWFVPRIKMQLDVEVSPPAFVRREILLARNPYPSFSTLFLMLPGTLSFKQACTKLGSLTSYIICMKPVKWASNNIFWPGDLDLWPMTLTFRVDLWVIHVNAQTKFHNPRCNGFWDMNFGLVTDIQTYRKQCIWAHRAYAQVIIMCKMLYLRNHALFRSSSQWHDMLASRQI